MARKIQEITLGREFGRDEGKTFVLTEMDAEQAETWGMRALLALANAGIDIPDSARGGGMAGIAVTGFQSLHHVGFADLKPLLDEMFDCVKISVPAAPAGRRLLKDDIEEVQTRLHLRAELIKLHTGFSIADAMTNLRSSKATKEASADSSNTTTSQGASA